jgi:putative flippase GtrA
MKRADLIQFVKYWVGGGVYFWTGYAIFALCYSGIGWNWLPAKVAGDVVGLTANFFVQRYWAFNHPSLRGKTFQISARYIAVMSLSLAIDYLIVGGLKHLGVSPYAGLFVAATFFTVWNFVWYKFWVFRRPIQKD